MAASLLLNPTTTTTTFQKLNNLRNHGIGAAAPPRLCFHVGKQPRPNLRLVMQTRPSFIVKPTAAAAKGFVLDCASHIPVTVAVSVACVLTPILLREIHNKLNWNVPYETSVFAALEMPLQFLIVFFPPTSCISRMTESVSHIIAIAQIHAIVLSAVMFLYQWKTSIMRNSLDGMRAKGSHPEDIAATMKKFSVFNLIGSGGSFCFRMLDRAMSHLFMFIEFVKIPDGLLFDWLAQIWRQSSIGGFVNAQIRHLQDAFNLERDEFYWSSESTWRKSTGGSHQHYQQTDWYRNTYTSYGEQSSYTPTTGDTSDDLSHHYAVLGLRRLRKKPYTNDEIKAAFRIKAKKYHPDKNPGKKKFAETKFKKIMRSYEAIKAERAGML